MKLIEQLENVGRKVVTESASNLMEQLNGLYRMVCHLEKEKVQSFLEDKTTCVCGYELNKGIRTVIKSTQDQISSDFTQHCIGSLRNLHLMLHNNKDRYEELSKGQGVEQQAENLFRAIEEIITDSRKAAKEQIDQVTDLIVNMRSVLSKTLEVPELKKPKPEAITFSRILSEFRREVGEKATVTEFVEWIKRRYKEQEEIVIDIP
ncbi:MAG: hypothetical protein H3Z52_09335 [archaeon]|nr:hypothetical protein [archaeon]